MSIENNEPRQPDGRGVSMVDREPIQYGPNPGRKPEQTVLRNLRAPFRPLPPLPSALEQRIVGIHGLGIWRIPVYSLAAVH
jgi:hypothetical protein